MKGGMGGYRREISDACNWHQEQALNSTIYILYQTGPTGFLLKEEGEAKNFKVFLGDTHNCSCSVFKKEKDLCKHICWIILKKFRIPRNDPLSWQFGFNEREINQLIRGNIASQDQRSNNKKASTNKVNQSTLPSSAEIEQRPITESDVCPICQDELLAKKLPVTHCRYGCGNNVHIKCMKVWADHQKKNTNNSSSTGPSSSSTSSGDLKCPLCRETFSSFELLNLEFKNCGLLKAEKLNVHHGYGCQSCKAMPITGKCYKCASCAEFYLCQACFNTDVHGKHSFVFREQVTQKYRKADRQHASPLAIPQAVVANMASRELSEQDYELLVQLDTTATTSSNVARLSQIPEKVIKSWPLEKVRDNSALLGPGHQCRVCLRAFELHQLVRKLPSCKHKFHANCIDNWLLHSHPTCPIDGQIVWDPITAQLNEDQQHRERIKQQHQINDTVKKLPLTKPTGQQLPMLDMIINYKRYVIENKPKSSKASLIEKQHAIKSDQSKPLALQAMQLSLGTGSSNLDHKSSLQSNNKTKSLTSGTSNTNVNSGSNSTSNSSMSRHKEDKQKEETDRHVISIPSVKGRTQLLPRIEVNGTKVSSTKLQQDTNDINNTNKAMTNQNDRLLAERTHDVFSLASIAASRPYQLTTFIKSTPANFPLPTAPESSSICRDDIMMYDDLGDRNQNENENDFARMVSSLRQLDINNRIRMTTPSSSTSPAQALSQPHNSLAID